MAVTSSDPAQSDAVVLEGATTTIGGFDGVLGNEACNRDVFERCLQDRLGTVLRGGTASLFCYGYTGSGKTHTSVGYGTEKGLYYLAADHLLQQVCQSCDGLVFLSATAVEVFNDGVFD